MPVFSFRAECLVDVETFVHCLANAGVSATIDYHRPGAECPIPDVIAEFKSDAPLDDLREAARMVPDGHVIVQTLRQCLLSQNTLERDTTVSP